MIILNHKRFKKAYFSNSLLRSLLSVFPDCLYIPLMYYLQTGKILSLRNPKTYCEKIQWLKLYGNYEDLTDYADKVVAKLIAQRVIGEEHIVPTLGVWDCFEDIDFDSLPNEFVLKCTHDSGGYYLCQDKNTIPYKELQKFFKNRLGINYYWYLRERQYKNIVPRIIAEPLLSRDKHLVDYKFFCFDGLPEVLMVVHVVDGKRYSTYYDATLKPIDVSMGNPPYPGIFKLPENIHDMRQIAEILAKNQTHVRIDMYNVDGKIYFGEFTFHHWSGMLDIQPFDFDICLGELIDCSGKRENYGSSKKE